jgi:outer membrane protein assembly factor BamA
MRLHRYTLFLLLLPVFAGKVSAQVIVDTTTLSETVIVDSIFLSGNNITREPVITREYLFNQGDTLQKEIFLKLLERTRENIINTFLFNFVTVHAQATTGANVSVTIHVEERWYIFPLPIFELVDRNFNEWVKSGDWSRVNFGLNLKWSNFRGMGETMNFLFKWGYTENLGLHYIIPYINKNREEGLAIKTTYVRDKEVVYSVGESRPLRFNGNSTFMRRELSGALAYSRRKGYYKTSTFFAEYRTVSITDTIASLNPEYLGAGKTEQECLTFSWLYRRDFRDIRVYPLKGYLLDLEATKLGFGVFQNEPNLLYFTAQYRKYHKLSERWFLAGSVKGKLSGQSTQPFFNMKGLGFNNDFVRGYELYIVPGQNYMLTKTNLKFALLPTRVIEVPSIPLEKFRKIHYAFYLNAFFDIAYVRDRQYKIQNPLANDYHYGYGLGLDYVTYYNLVFRVEYSMNKFGEDGFFLHFTAPI